MKRALSILIFAFFVAVLATNAQTSDIKRKPKQATPKTSNLVGKKSETKKSRTFSTKSTTQKKKRNNSTKKEELWILANGEDIFETDVAYSGGTVEINIDTNMEDVYYHWLEAEIDSTINVQTDTCDTPMLVELNAIEEYDWCRIWQGNIIVDENTTPFTRDAFISFDGGFKKSPGALVHITQAANPASKKKHENFNVNVNSSTFNNGYQNHIVLSVQGTESNTIVEKRCLPSPKTSWMKCTPNEFIEDCDTGKRYYLQGSSIGINNAKYFYDTTLYYYTEYYPKLPDSVTRINISSGDFYYAKNIRIR